MRVLAFDLGGSSVKSGIVEDDFTVTHKQKYVLEGESIETVREEGVIAVKGVHSAETFADAIVTIWKDTNEKVDGVAFSYNCPADHKTGDTFEGGLSGRFLNNQNFPSLFAGKCPLPITVAKDGNCQLLAEVEAGSLQGCKSALALGIGSGIAFGYISDGELLSGGHFYAGEVSSIVQHNEKGERVGMAFNCGMWGLLNRIAAATGKPAQEMNGFIAFDLIHQGSPEVLKAFDDYCEAVAEMVFNFQCVLEPDAISIGGGISQQQILIDRVREKVSDLVNSSHFRPKYPPVIRQSKCFNESNLIGAAIAFRRYARPVSQI